MNHLRQREFWNATIARAVWTLCETFLAVVGTAKVIDDVNWDYVIAATVFSALLSIAKSVVAGVPEVGE